MPRALASPVLCLFLLTTCSSPTASVSPDPMAPFAASATAGQSSTPLPVPGASGGESTQSPGPGSGALPIRGSAREIGLAIQMAPAPDGSLFVSIPAPGGAVLTRLDRRGSPMSAWAITVPDSTACGRPMLADDGTVRIVCDAADQAPPELGSNDMRAFAFDADGRLMAGWPVLVRPAYTGRGLETELTSYADEWRVIGDALVYLELLEAGDVIEDGQPFGDARVVMVAADGTTRAGKVVPQFDYACCRWTVGSDGVAYGVQGPAAPPTVSQVIAIDSGGVRDGWPIRIEGIASKPAFALDGRLILTVALPGPGSGSSRVVTVDGDGNVTDQSAELLIETGVLPPSEDGTYECGVPVPRPALVAPDGRIYVYGEIDDATYGLDASLDVLSGWPIVAGSLERPNPWLGQGDLDCAELAIPAAGPGGTVLLPLQARDPALGGGRLVAIGSDGEPRPGWPVSLSRPGSEFWSVVVGADGTTYAVAIEPEAGGASSATVLAIAPDSTVIFATTVVDP